MKKEIPIMFCFDKNYVIPAAACFISIMEHANSKNNYHFYVLHSDISKENQNKLTLDMKKFSNCKLEFIDMNNKFKTEFKNVENKAHFSKEVLYKLICGSIFPNINKLIITDVDVIFLDDIAKIYDELSENDPYYFAGIPPIKTKPYIYKDKPSYKKFDETELAILENGIGGGFLLANLKRIRDDNFEEKLVNYLIQNATKLIQMEQDVINVVGGGVHGIKHLPYYYMVCSYHYNDFNDSEAYKKLIYHDEKDVKYALEHPVQLHYATCDKPWSYVDCAKSEIWFQYIVKSVFLRDFLEELPSKIKTVNDFLQTMRKKHKKLYNFLLKIYHLIKKILFIK